MNIIWWVTGGIIIGVLLVIAIRLQAQVRAMEKRMAKEQADRDKQQTELRQKTNNSIRILARGLVSDQLTLTEGCIRISALLDSLGVSDEQKQDYRAIFQLANETAHIPILAQWKKLSKQEQINFDIERVTLEQKYADFVKDNALRLQESTF